MVPHHFVYIMELRNCTLKELCKTLAQYVECIADVIEYEHITNSRSIIERPKIELLPIKFGVASIM